MTENPATSKLTFPSDADYRNRIERAQAEMKKHGIDVLALAGIDIHRFFTRIERPAGHQADLAGPSAGRHGRLRLTRQRS